MKYYCLIWAFMALASCNAKPDISAETRAPNALAHDVDVTKTVTEPISGPIVKSAWHSALISAPDIDDMAQLWLQIGGYEILRQDKDNIILGAPETSDGYIHILRNNKPNARPARPLDATAWDTGCYWSLMMRAKDIASIIRDAQLLGWEPLTQLAYLEFGPSKLNIIILRHQITGMQVQLYERLNTAVPKAFPEFERLSRPFNIMQMVQSQSRTHDFFEQGLGFDTFYFGRPTTSPTPQISPLGIPKDLTPDIPYKAAIVYPQKGMEWGRFEMIDVENMDGARDFSENCHRGNWGLLEVHFINSDLENISQTLLKREINLDYIQTQNGQSAISIASPDGARIIFNP